MRAQAGLRLVITRPEPGANRFAAAVRDRFGTTLPVIVAPLMALVVPPGPPPPALAGAAGLVFTAAAGVAGLSRRCPGLALPAFCVGARTAAAAAAAGHAAIALGGDADALVAALVARRVAGPLVHIRGADSRGAVAARLTAAGIPTAEAVVYAQEPRPLAPEAAAALAGEAPVIAALFSPRSAVLFAAAAAGARAPLLVAAISTATRAAWDAAPAAPPAAIATAIAATPDEAGMLAAVADLVAAAPRA
jgi:uroporphyrinogen-III synthase